MEDKFIEDNVGQVDENNYYKFSVDDLITVDAEASIIKEQYSSLTAEQGIYHIPVKENTDILHLLEAAALLVMNNKIPSIDESRIAMLTKIQSEKEFQMENDLETLTDIMNHYNENLDDPDYVQAKLAIVTEIEREARISSNFYQKEAEDRLEKKGFFHLHKDVRNTFDMFQKQFDTYRLALYVFAFATFLEVMLSQFFREEYLDEKIHLLRSYAYRYREVYTACYEQLESYQRSAVESQVLKAGAEVSHILGKGIAKIPVINKGPVDEKLIEIGDTMADYDEDEMRERMEAFRANNRSGINIFIENLIIVKSLCNNTGELLWDEEYLYVKKPVALVG